MATESIDDQIGQIVEKIILKRKQKGWTYENMANELGISPATYHKIENRITKLSLARFLQISRILEIKVEEFFGISGNIYNQEFRDKSSNQNQVVHNLYQDNRELTERYIERLEKEIEELKAKQQ